jgi:hypothetical protein
MSAIESHRTGGFRSGEDVTSAPSGVRGGMGRDPAERSQRDEDAERDTPAVADEPAAAPLGGRPTAALLERWTTVFDRAISAAERYPSAEGSLRSDLLKTVRKATKTGRALLGLIGPGLAPESASGAERAFADAAGLLSPMRDRDALLATIDRLFRAGPATNVDAERARQVRAGLVRIVLGEVAIDDQSTRTVDEALVVRAVAALRRGHAVLGSVEPARVGQDELAVTIAEHWRSARRRAEREWNVDGEEPHELRKECSRLVHQLLLVEGIDPPKRLRRFRRTLRSVTSALGEEHDLAILAERLSMERDRLGNAGFLTAVLRVCRTTRRTLREEAGKALADAARVKPRELEDLVGSLSFTERAKGEGRSGDA